MNLLQHSKAKGYGENIFSQWASNGFKILPNGGKGVDSWYNEIKDYNFKTGKANSPGAVVGHFTQVVWDNLDVFKCLIINLTNF